MPPRLRPASVADVRAALDRIDVAQAAGIPAVTADERLLVRHFLAVLVERAPGRSVEVRIPPYAAVQAISGVRHTRGTPPAVVETDARTWIALARGHREFLDAINSGDARASGERSDLSAYLPLTPT